MKTRVLTVIFCVLPIMLYAQSYEQQGDELYAQGEYAKAVKKYDAAMALDGETSSLKQKKSNASKCSSLLSKAKTAEADKNYSEASKFYSSLYSVHALPAYKSKATSMQKKAYALQREKEEQERLQREKEEQERRLQREKEEQERRLQQERLERERALKSKNSGFSVSPSKKVKFSQGNLQYQASTDTWRFAEHQYDYVGNANNISSTYSGWIDLFGWGTGNNPTLASTNDSDYSTFTDWGVNKISNGGNTTNQWRTLTKDEWVYLYSGRTNAARLRSQATVNNVYGYILLPDSWLLPSGMSFTANANKWTTNTYSAADWAKMEQSGAVFLPAAGGRNGTNVYGVGSDGFYWSSTPGGTNRAFSLYFDSGYVDPLSISNRSRGRSVRLVQDL